LDGLDEIGGGIYADAAPSSPGALLSELTGLLWFLGLEFVPVPGSNDWNGVQFDENFGGGVATMYTDTVGDVANPMTGYVTDVAFSGEGAIAGWTLLNVGNPDLAILLPDAINAVSSGKLLPPAGIVEVIGNPTDGWTLESFAGQAFPQDPGLLTSCSSTCATSSWHRKRRRGTSSSPSSPARALRLSHRSRMRC
jgi:hypothetical protein